MENSIRQFEPVDKRVETGPIRFGDDFPGLFIRGDNAYGYALHLEYILDKVLDNQTLNAIDELQLRDLRDLLFSSHNAQTKSHK